MVDFKYQFTVKNRDGSKITREGMVQDTTYYTCSSSIYDREMKKIVPSKPERGARVQIEKMIDAMRADNDIVKYSVKVEWKDSKNCEQVRVRRVAFSDLTFKEIEKVEDFVQDLEVDESSLDSARWDSNPYGVEPQLAIGSGCWVYDDDDYYNAQLEKALDCIESDGAWEYIKGFCLDEDGDPDEDLNEKIIQYLKDMNDGWYVVGKDD